MIENGGAGCAREFDCCLKFAIVHCRHACRAAIRTALLQSRDAAMDGPHDLLADHLDRLINI